MTCVPAFFLLFALAANASKVSSISSSSSYTLDVCPIFYQTLTEVPSQLHGKVSQWDIRRQNVEWSIANHSELNLKKMNVLYWARDWEIIKDLFQGLGLSLAKGDFGNPTLNQGKVGRWATLIMMAAWQKHAGHACTIALEDDILIPHNFKELLGQVSQPEDVPSVIKFDYWGEGYAFNLKSVDQFMSYLIENPVLKVPSDNCINAGCAGPLMQRDVGISKLVASGEGNIQSTPFANITAKNCSVDRNKAWQELTKTAELAGQDLSAASRAAAISAFSFVSLEDFNDGVNVDLLHAARIAVQRMHQATKSTKATSARAQ